MLGRLTLITKFEGFDHCLEWRRIGTGKAFKEAKGEQVKYHIDFVIQILLNCIFHFDGSYN